MKYASAEVRKQFFIEMFTRDISLEDCVLDLIDNSLDSYLLKHDVSISQLIFGPNGHYPSRDLGKIDVTCSDRQIKVVDTCGGITRKRAVEEIFCFGHDEDDLKGKLGAYGVGMKRALFKIGNTFHIISRTAREGFEVSFRLDQWAREEKWRVPITFVDGTNSEKSAGTSITIMELHDEVAQRIREGGVPKNILEDAASTYPYFLLRCVKLKINETEVLPDVVPLGEKQGVIRSANEKFEQDGVKVTLAATIAPGLRKAEQAGWYVLCNGRVVVRANRDDLTGWGTDLASFQPKYRSFVGLASFESDDPLSLPWTTTKRYINRESSVFMRARGLMVAMSKPILTFLNSQYPSEPSIAAADIRDAVEGVREVPFKDIASRPPAGFSYKAPKKKERKEEWVRFSASIGSLDKVRRHLRRPSLTASEIGKLTFEHFLKTECAAD
jgi:Histidine kinase-, DNA gyrase B-, and HSP90-like ATPase